MQPSNIGKYRRKKNANIMDLFSIHEIKMACTGKLKETQNQFHMSTK
jgi:hypothetical protein